MKNVFVNLEKGVLLDKRLVHKLVGKVAKNLILEIDHLEINIVTQKTIVEINNSYLKHNYPTDIITFNYSGSNVLLDGEIFICMKVALENALRFDVDLDSEIVRLVIHGILHLAGFDDKRVKDREKMKNKENELVKLFEIDFKNLIIEYDSEDS